MLVSMYIRIIFGFFIVLTKSVHSSYLSINETQMNDVSVTSTTSELDFNKRLMDYTALATGTYTQLIIICHMHIDLYV